MTRTLIQTIRIATLIFLPVGLVINSLPVGAQTRRGTTRRQTAAPPSKSTPPTPTVKDDRVQLVRSRRSQNMSRAFTNGKLPEPVRLPIGNVDQQASALAKAVSAGDDSSTAALHAAVLAAGFGVRDTDGSVMQTTDRGQGLAFDAWEIAVASKQYGDGYGVTLKHLSDAFTRHLPEFRDAQFAAALQEGIRSGAASQNPSIRFWARFIVELGRNSQPSYDLLRQADAARIRLDPVQTSFILKRLLGEFAAHDRQAASVRFDSRNRIDMQKHASYVFASADDIGVQFINADMRPTFAKIPARTQSPCPVEGIDGVILDYSAVGSTSLFGWLAGMLGGKAGGYGKGVGVANIILTILKVIATYALLKAVVTIDSHPMVRTKNTRAGEKRVLSAKLEIDPTKWQIINCFRPALNLMGLDFNLPDAGPVQGSGVEWKLIEGGDPRGGFGPLLDFVDIALGEATWPKGQIVSFQPLPGTDDSPANQQTGDDGISRMGIVGVPQARDLSNEKLVKVNKIAGVKVGIQAKTMKITDKVKLASTIGDAGGNVLSFLTGDIAGGIIGTGAETLFRSHWYSSEPFYFIVNDWEPCAGLWQGTMTTTSFNETRLHEGGGANEFTRKFDSSYRFNATIKFEGTKAMATIEVEETISDDQRSGYGRVTDLQKRTAHYSGEVKASASVSNGKYDVSFELPRFVGTYESSGSCERPAPYKCQQPTPVHKPWQFNDPRYLSFATGDVDPNKPNEINDTQTKGNAGSLQHKITVNMKRCQ